MKPEEYYKGVSSIDGMVNRRPDGLSVGQVREAIDLGMEQEIVQNTRPLQVTRAVWALAWGLKGKAYEERERLIEDAEGKIARREKLLALQNKRVFEKEIEIDDLTTNLTYKRKKLRNVLFALKKWKARASRRFWYGAAATSGLIGVVFWDDIYGYLAYIYRMVTQ